MALQVGSWLCDLGPGHLISLSLSFLIFYKEEMTYIRITTRVSEPEAPWHPVWRGSPSVKSS